MYVCMCVFVYIHIYIYIYIYILEFSCRYPSTDDRLVAWIVQLHLSVCFLALLAMSVFCSKCLTKVSPETTVSGPLGRQVGSGMAVVGALGRQGGAEMATLVQNRFLHSGRPKASGRNVV